MMANEGLENLPAFSQLDAVGEVGWRDIAEQTDTSFGDLLVELGRQALHLPTFTATKTPTQQAMFDSVLLARAAKSNAALGTHDRHSR